MTCLITYWSKIHRIFVYFSLFWHRVSFFLFSSIKIITIRYENTQKKKKSKRLYYNNLFFCKALLANSIINGLSVKLIYKIVFLKNTRLCPLVKITIHLSNFLTRNRTIVFFKEEENLSGLLIKKKLSVSKATCPQSVFKTVQIILWETPVTKSSKKFSKI